MRCSVSFVAFVVAVTATSAQNPNFGLNPTFPQNQFQNFDSQGQNLGTTHFPLYQQFEENYLQADRYFYLDIDLLKVLCDKQRDGNILISPLSIKSILAMLLEGARDGTAEELRMALHLPNNQRVRQQFGKLLNKIKSPTEGVHLKMANGIFVGNKYNVLDDFRNIVNQYYSADVKKVDFTEPVQSTNIINKWVNENTNGIIPKLVEDGSLGDVPILLANALYFKGTWERAFSELGTKNSCFYLPNGECQTTPMMDVVDNFKYGELKQHDAKVVELPYHGRQYSMVIMLPNNRNGIQLLSRDITKLNINEYLKDLNETEVFVTLPRFKISYDVDLVKYLPEVHISRIFNPNAELNGVVAEFNTRVSNMLHKTFMEVNEQGTIAAAATGAVVIPLMGITKPRVKADHPFLFFIRHIPTGTIVFEGRVSEPERSAVQNHQTQQQKPQAPVQQPTAQRATSRPAQHQPSSHRPVPPHDNFNQFTGPTQSQPQPQQSFQTQPNFQNPAQQAIYETTQLQEAVFQSTVPVNFNSQSPQFPAPTPNEQTYQHQQEQHIQPQQQQQHRQPQQQSGRPQAQAVQNVAFIASSAPGSSYAPRQRPADDPNVHGNDVRNEQLKHSSNDPVWPN